MNLSSTTKQLKQERDIGRYYVCVCVCAYLNLLANHCKVLLSFLIVRWYCHFDDDEYVNIPVLMKTLHVHEDKLYLGYWPSNSRWRGRKVKVRRTVS